VEKSGSNREPQHRSIFSNGMWATVQQSASMAGNSVIAIILITVLPVDQFGVYSYALALCAFGMAIMNGGVSSLAIREFVSRPDEAGLIVSTVTVVRETLALVALVLIWVVSLTSGDSSVVAASVVASASLFGRALDAPELWYRAKMMTHRAATIRLAITVAFFVARLAAITLAPDIWVFIALYVGEALVSGVGLVIRFAKDRDRPSWSRATWREAWALTRSSWPLLLSGIANQVNLRADVVVIQILSGATSVAVYSAAARISELAYFVPVVFMNASLPVLLRHKNASDGDQKYNRMLQRSYDSAFWTGVLIALGAFGAGAVLIQLFFGNEYQGAVGVLAIHVIACPFVFMAAVYSKWIVAEKLLWLSLWRHMAGAVINVGLCFIMIPILGLVGAAWATVVSYVVASFFSCFLDRRAWPAGVQMVRAMIAPVRYTNSWVQRRLESGRDR
jgi:O-antigen/teichoic acid export membrane protein